MWKLFLPVLALSAYHVSLSVNASSSQSAEEYGLEIVREYDKRDQGFSDLTADMEMVLINSHGQKSTRLLRTKTLEVDAVDIGEKRLLIFDKPRDVKGTVMLTATRKNQSDDQWLYLPAVKRIKRITSNNRTGPFMGSEFSYEDLGAVEIEKYTYIYIDKKPCDGGECFLVERYPKDKDSGYTRQIVWIDDSEYRLWKVEFYDRKDALLKILTITGYKQYLNKFWRAERMLMDNFQTGKKTILNWDNYQFKVGLNQYDFQANQLARIR